ncbi:MAG: flagellar protein FlaG [Desulfobacula sp.]|nr:flagellar protein FlaG [Desulfobacula sp.]
MNIDTINTAVRDTAPVEKTIISPAPSKVDTADNIQNRQAAEKTKEEQSRILSAKETKELTNEMNDLMDDLQTSLGFSIREELNHQIVVEIKNRETNELIKQIPSEELLTIKEKMEEFTGLIFDQSV